jgi:hypothetical protein
MATKPINLVNTCGVESVRQVDRDPARQALMDVNDAAMAEVERLRGQRDRLRDTLLVAERPVSMTTDRQGAAKSIEQDYPNRLQPGDMTSD